MYCAKDKWCDALNGEHSPESCIINGEGRGGGVYHSFWTNFKTVFHIIGKKSVRNVLSLFISV